jgi:hypothetical protein
MDFYIVFALTLYWIPAPYKCGAMNILVLSNNLSNVGGDSRMCPESSSVNGVANEGVKRRISTINLPRNVTYLLIFLLPLMQDSLEGKREMSCSIKLKSS